MRVTQPVTALTEPRRETPPPLPHGTRAGSFVIERPIAEGGFGAVYEARDAGGRRAAVKVLHGELAASDHVVVRFEREVGAIRRIRHPNVVDVWEVGRLDDGRPYYAMELCAGRDLTALIKARGRLPAREVLAILAPVCDALAAAHALGIVHRDVKPGNVLLVGDRPVLVDFGIAKLLDEEGLTTSRQAIGTPAFMAPEQAGGRVDARADVYAVGALAFYLLTGTTPFAHDSPTMMVYLHRHARRAKPSSRAPVAAAVDEVIVRAMRASPADRYPDIASFAAALAAASGSDAPVADESSVACRIRIDSRDDDADVIADAIALVHDQAATQLGAAGFVLAIDACRAQLWVSRAGALPGNVLAAAQSAARAVERCAPVAVRVRTSLRVGDVSWRAGRPVGGALLEPWEEP